MGRKPGGDIEGIEIERVLGIPYPTPEGGKKGKTRPPWSTLQKCGFTQKRLINLFWPCLRLLVLYWAVNICEKERKILATELGISESTIFFFEKLRFSQMR